MKLDFIFEISDLQTKFTCELMKLCDKYGEDITDTLIKAGVILTQTAEITAKNHEAFKSLMD